MKRYSQTFITVIIFLLFLSTMAHGDIWLNRKRLTHNAGSSAYPAMAIDGSNIYVVWHDYTPGNFEIYFKKSDDGGVTWSARKRLTHNTGASAHPAIAVDGPNIYVVWGDDTLVNREIYFKKSVDGGATWSKGKRITHNAGGSGGAAIGVDGSNIYVVWFDNTPGNEEIYFKKSVDGGATWSKGRRLSYRDGSSRDPDIAVDGSNIYVVWYDDRNLDRDRGLYFKKSVDGGVSWSAHKTVANTLGDALPQMVVDGSNIYVVWHDRAPGNPEIYFNKSVDGGATWSASERLTDSAGNPVRPDIAVDGSNIYVVWHDDIDDTPGNNEIYFKKSDDGGATWSAHERLTNNPGDSYAAVIAVEGSNIYVVWHDDTPGNAEIYFKQGLIP
jgi:Neuraminidase (sialidase)